MIEFFLGFFVGILAVILPLISGWITKQDYKMINELEDNDFDYNSKERNLEDCIDSPFDPENYFIYKKEGTK